MTATKLRICKANTKSAHYRRFDLAGCPAVKAADINSYIKQLRKAGSV